jgi:Family of unknown function (DUF6502)
MSENRGLTGGIPDYLISAVVESLEPLVRLCIAKGMTYPVMDELVRTLFVSVANRDFGLENKEQTQSRISVITGLNRREVKRLDNPSARAALPAVSATRGGELVSKWISTAPFIDSRGKPRPLPKTISQGGKRSFEALVASFSKDIRARTVLDEWVRSGVVTIDESDRVCLKVDSFIATDRIEEKAFYFGQNLGDHAAAAVSNLLGQSPAFPDRSVYRDELSPKSIAQLTKLAERLAMRAISDVNREAERLEPADKRDGLATHRVNFGFYIYGAPMDSSTRDPNQGRTDNSSKPKSRVAKRRTK